MAAPTPTPANTSKEPVVTEKEAKTTETAAIAHAETVIDGMTDDQRKAHTTVMKAASTGTPLWFEAVHHVGNYKPGDLIDGGSLDTESKTRLLGLGAIKRVAAPKPEDEDDNDE